MKKLGIIIIALGLGVAASAQKISVGVHGHVGGSVYYKPGTSLL